jgi:AcrR family transcriptional regulator
MASTTTPPDRRSARHQATRQEIVDVAWRLAEERGLAGWALKDVADAVGMRTPSLYVYVESKNDLYDAMYADGYRQLEARIDRLRVPADPRAALRLAARTFVDFCAENGPRYQLLFLRTVPGFEPSAESYALAVRMLERMGGELARAGAGKPSDVDLWTALVTGLASQQVSNDPGGRRWRRLTDDAVDMFLASRAR